MSSRTACSNIALQLTVVPQLRGGCRQLSLVVSRLEIRIILPMLYSPAFSFSSVYPLGFFRVQGFAFRSCANFKHFWPLALSQKAPPAIIFQAVRRLRGTVLFCGSRPSSSWGFPFWRFGLTMQSSRPAFGRRLTFVR